MERWFDEVRITKRTLEEIGLAFYVREILGNNAIVNRWDLTEIFGIGWKEIAEGLERDGILKTEEVGKDRIRMRIDAKGDKKRKRSRERERKRRKSNGE